MPLQRIVAGSSALLKITIEENDVAVNISGASTMQITIVKPDLTTITPSTDFVTDGTDGQLEAQLNGSSTSGIDQEEIWQYNAAVTLAGFPYVAGPIQFAVVPAPQTPTD